MKNSKESKKENNTIKISGAISIYEAADIHKQLLQSFIEKDIINLDLDEVNSCDVTGIQLLFSAIRTSEEEGKKINILKVSETIKETVRLIGVQADRL